MGTALTKFVKEQCTNWKDEPEEECLGIDVHGKSFREPGKCWVFEDEPCTYFKNNVLGPEDNKYPHQCFVKEPAFEKRVRRQYQRIDHTMIHTGIRRCPDCSAALRVRQRYCDKCSLKRRKKTQRENQRRFRHEKRVCA